MPGCSSHNDSYSESKSMLQTVSPISPIDVGENVTAEPMIFSGKKPDEGHF